MVNKKENVKAIGYFEDLAKGTQNLVKELIEEFFTDNCEVFHADIQEIECKSRSGFIPFDSNRGGLEINGFTDLMSIWGSGTYPAHKGAVKEIERQIDYSFDLLAEHCFDKFKELANKYKLTKVDFNYHRMYELEKLHEELEQVTKYIEESEVEFLGDEQSSIMYNIRFMYHGKANGKHSASVSAAVNTEGPYHRSHISWAPNVFCEGAKEIEIEWTNQTELKKELAKALAKVCKEVL
jgi:hypothetical protein